MAKQVLKLFLLSLAATAAIFTILKVKDEFDNKTSQQIASEYSSFSQNSLDSAFRNLRELMKHEKVKDVRRFLKKDLSIINKSDVNGITPLHIATYYQDSNLVEFLLKKGAAPDLRTRDGFTPLHIAVYKGNFKIVNLLLSTKEVDVNRVTTEDNYSPLHIGIRFTSPHNILKELTQAGANVNSRTKRGRTPLHIGVIRGDIEAIKFLLQKKARVNTFSLPSEFDAGGKTPLDDALEKGCGEIINLLKAHGAQQSSNSGSLNFYQEE